MKRWPVDLKALKVFLTVSSTGGMTQAAQALGLTQSAVSQAIQQLERHVGASLLDRSCRPLRLTAAGSILARRAGRLVDEAEQLPAALREASNLPEIRVGMIDSFAGTAGPHLIRDAVDRVANVTLWAGLTPQLAQALVNRQVDLVVTTDDLDDVDGLSRMPLVREPFVLALPRTLGPGAGGLNLAALAERHMLVRYSARSAIGLQIDRHLRRLGVRAPRRLEIDSSDTLFGMVAAGVGWAITTPLCILHGRPDTAAIRFHRLPGPGVARTLVMLARDGEYDEMQRRLCATARTALREHCAPAIRRVAPWLRDEFHIY